MKKHLLSTFLTLVFCTVTLFAQRGYDNAPYERYEADEAILSSGAVATPHSYAQSDLQSEASGQVCVDMSSENATAEFTFNEAADGLVIRYSVPDGDSAVILLYSDGEKLDSLVLGSKWSWEYLWKNGDPNNEGIVNENPRMRFDEIRYHLPEKLSSLSLVKKSGQLSLDFVEMEVVPDIIPAPDGAAVFEGDGSTLQAFIDANGSKTIYIPPGVYHISTQLYFGVDGTALQGAGMWYTQLNFTETSVSNGGLRANARDISYSDLHITTDMTTRTNAYAGIHGIYTSNSRITNIWVEHTGTGAWIAQYVSSGPAYADGFYMSGCRFRNTYADGMNLCKGTRNALVEHCNFRNNGDDGMAIWSAEGLECFNNTYRYNTVENGWRAAGVALYGGKDNKFYNNIIRDNIDVGITITNTFPGVGFNEEGLHDFHDITISGCGTYNGTYNERLGAINIYHASSAGTKIQNIRMYNIDIEDAKCDGIRIKRNSGEGIYGLVFENVSINGTGVEYPANNVNNSTGERGFAVFFENSPRGEASYCNLSYDNLGGNANGVAFSTDQQGPFSWTEQLDCDITAVDGISLSPADTTIAGGASFKLRPLFSPANATNRIVTYISSDPEIASVDYDGLVTGLSRGQTTISVVAHDGYFVAHAVINVSSDPRVYYYIKNRWQSTYLYDAGSQVRYQLNASNDKFLWEIEENDGFQKIRNIQSGDYMHIEDMLGYVQCTPGFSQSESAKWNIEDEGEGFVRIKKEGESSDYIHVENLNGQAQYGSIESSWWSAMWLLEPVLATSLSTKQTKKELSIYPNPSDGHFELSTEAFKNENSVDVSLLSTSGQVLFQQTYNTGKQEKLNISINTGNKLAPGTYLLVITGKSGSARSKIMIYR